MEELPKKRLQPKKSEFRARAHCNPFNNISFSYPISSQHINWDQQFGNNLRIFCNSKKKSAEEHPFAFSSSVLSTQTVQPSIIDVGCGFGGLLFGLSPLFPSSRILGMEIRNKLVNYVAKKICATRQENPGKVRKKQFLNISVVRTNAMKNLPNFCGKESLEKLFFCFPDPNFKKSHYRRRIVNKALIMDYCYLLKPGGKIYAITDVFQLHEWHLQQLSECKTLVAVDEEENLKDPCLQVILSDTEEGKKVTRNLGKKYWCIFQKVG